MQTALAIFLFLLAIALLKCFYLFYKEEWKNKQNNQYVERYRPRAYRNNLPKN